MRDHERVFIANEALEKVWGISSIPSDQCLNKAFIPRPYGFIVAEPRPISIAGKCMLFLVRKKGLSTYEAAKWLTKATGARSFHFYGLKDSSAIAYQYIVLCGIRKLSKRIAMDEGRVLAWLVSENVSPPKKGAHGWNYFRISIKPFDETKLTCPGNSERGYLYFANYYGPQRFGTCIPSSHYEGFLAIKNPSTLEKHGRKLFKFERRMVLEGLQAFIFNLTLSKLVEKYGLMIPKEVSGRSGRLSLPGHIESPPRVPLGFLPSREFLLESRGEWAETLIRVLEDIGIELGDLRGVRSVPRPLVSAAELYLCRENRDGSIELSFALSKGSYASVFLRHYYRLIWLMDCLERIECPSCLDRRLPNHI